MEIGDGGGGGFGDPMSEKEMKRSIRKLRQEVYQLRKELQDAEHTHDLRSMAEEVMKKEIGDL